MATITEIRARKVAAMRAAAGLPPSPESDRIWAQRLGSTSRHSAMYQRINQRLQAKAASGGGSSSGGSSGGLRNYQRTDQHYAQNEALAADRIRQIYRNDPEAPSDTKIQAMASNAVRQGFGYFDTIRENKGRYLSAVNGTDPNAGGPDEDEFTDEDGNGVEDGIQIDYEARARALYPWLPAPLLEEFIQHWTELDNEAAAWGQVRQGKDGGRYEEFFPGIKREDGSLRMSEQEYLGEIDGFEQAFESFGIPADTFRDKFVKFIEHGQSAAKVRQRLGKRFTEVASMSDEIRGFYAEKFGTGDLSMAALLASSLDPTMNPLVAEEQFKVARIGGTGREFGFEMAAKEAERLADFGMNRKAAQDFFGKAQSLVPTMRDLARRHNDPDDDFSIDNAADALVFEDPEEARRVRRLFAAEDSEFTSTGGMVSRDAGGRTRGLLAR